eukprot:207478_1
MASYTVQNKHCSGTIQLIFCMVFICICSMVSMNQRLNLYLITIINRHGSTNSFYNQPCESMLDLLRIKWHNNTNCSWDFIPSRCSIIHKYNASETKNFLTLLADHDIVLIFFGDSVTRRTGLTLDMFINRHGQMTPFRDKTYRQPMSYFIMHQKRKNGSRFPTVNWQTEWAPTAQFVTGILKNKTYTKHYWYNEHKTINIAVLGIGVWMYTIVCESYPNTTNEWMVEHLPYIVHEYVHWIYSNYFDVNNDVAMQNRKRLYIILRTQTAVGLKTPPECPQRTLKDIYEMTQIFNTHLIKYAQLYGIPVFDAYHWSAMDETYYINKENVVQNVEIYDQLDHTNCMYCGPHVLRGEYRHKCIECADGNCVHMRSNGRMILIQQILNAVNVLVHKESLLSSVP